MKQLLFLFAAMFVVTPNVAQEVFEMQKISSSPVDLASFSAFVELTFSKGSKIVLPYEFDYSKEADKTIVTYTVLAMPRDYNLREYLKRFAHGTIVCTGSNNALDRFIKMFLSDPSIKDACIIMKPQN